MARSLLVAVLIVMSLSGAAYAFQYAGQPSYAFGRDYDIAWGVAWAIGSGAAAFFVGRRR